MKKLKKDRIILISIIVLVFVVLLVRFGQSKNQESQELSRSINASLINLDEYKASSANINVIAEVESLEKVDISSELGARVTRVNVDIGDTVSEGQILMELDASILNAQLQQSQAAIDRMKANLDLSLAGASDEQIAQSQAQLDRTKASVDARIGQAELALELAENNLRQNINGESEIIIEAKENVVSAIGVALVSLESAQNLSNNILRIDYAPGPDIFQSTLSVLDFSKLLIAESSYREMRDGISLLKTNSLNVDLKNINQDTLLYEADQVLDLLLMAQTHFTHMNDILDNTVSSSELSEDLIIKAKNDILNTRASLVSNASALNKAVSSLSAGANSFESLQIAVTKAEQDLNNAIEQGEKEMSLATQTHNLLLAKPRDVDLASTRASIREAEASYRILAENRNKAIIRAPIDGTISKLSVSLGDYIGDNTDLLSIVNDQGKQLRAYINYSDLKQLNSGQSVDIGDGLARGVVDKVSPSIDPETGKVELLVLVTENDQDLVIGQFVDIDILLADKEDLSGTYFIPLSALQTNNQGSFVYTIDENSKAQSIAVESGSVLGDRIEVKISQEIDAILLSSRGLSDGIDLNIIK